MNETTQPDVLFAELSSRMTDLIYTWPTLGEASRVIRAEGLLKETTAAGRYILDPGQRSILTNLASNLRDKVFDATGVFPISRLDDPNEDVASFARVRAKELAYLEGIIESYRYWAEKYTPLAGIAEVRVAVAEGPQLDLPIRFIPAEFVKLVEYGFGEQRRIERVLVNDLREAVDRYRRLVILGEPGSGKTTTLRRLAHDYAVAAREDPQAPLPLLVPLGSYLGPDSAFIYVQQFFEDLGPQLATYLDNKRVNLLLDALNEMPQSGYRERVGRIQALLDQHPDVIVVVTSRSQDYIESLRLEKLEIMPLSPEQQHAYLHRYLGEIEGDKLFWQLCGGEEIADLWQRWQRAGGTWEQFWTATEIPDSVPLSRWSNDYRLWRAMRKDGLPPLLALGRNPFMLVMMAQVYAAGGGSLPQNRGRLFAAFVDTLLMREEMRCDPAFWPGADTLRQAMAHLAYAMQDASEPGSAIDTEWASRHLAKSGGDPRRILYLCASATLLDISYRTVRFVHKVVQEYFTALALARLLEEGDNLQRFWPKDWTQPSGWEEAFILLAGMLPDMTPLIERLIVANPPLAARCIAESGGARPKQHIVQAVQTRLVDLIQNPNVEISQRNVAGMAINHIGDPRPGVGLRSDGLPDVDWVLVPEKDPRTGRREFILSNGERLTEPDFWMARYPITYLQFQAFLDAADGYHNPRWWEGLAASQDHRASREEQWFRYWNHPRENVSWYDAIAYCRWLTAKAQEHPDLLPEMLRNAQGWRITLPTEWQWEKAARGHTGRQYPWGKKYDTGRANTGDRDPQQTSAVGTYPHVKPDDSPYGVADLSGNVWELCLSEYRIPEHVQEEGSAARVARGGSWQHGPSESTTVARDGLDPAGRRMDLGFRAVIVVDTPVP